MKVKKLLSLIFVAVIALGLASCDKCAKKPTPSTEAPTYTYRGYSSALGNNWNPHTWETNADQGILTYLSKGFVDLSIKDSKKGEYQWVYEMATDVKDVTASHQSDLTKYGSQLPEGKTLEEVTDGYVYEIVLNPKAKWENGVAITANDYIYSMQMLLNSKMKNYRANLYVNGESALAGALGYYNSESPIYTDLLERVPGYLQEDPTVNAAGQLVFSEGGQEYVLYTSFVNPVRFFGSDSVKDLYAGGYASLFCVPFTGDVSQFGENLPEWLKKVVSEESGEVSYLTDVYKKYSSQANAYGYIPVTAELFADLKAVALNCGDTNPLAWNEFMVFISGKGEKVEWDTVGLYKVDDYTSRYVLSTYEARDYFLTSLTDTWLVYGPYYEKGFDTTGELLTTNYGTSLDTTMSYGPYRLSVLQEGKQIVFVQNENWYGYTKKEDGTLYSETNFLVDGEHVQQYMTTKVVIDVMSDEAARQAFLSGALDEWAPSSSELSDYTLSEKLYRVDETYTMSFFFNTNLEALKSMDSSKGNKNSVVLSNVDFRKAFSLAIDRANWVLATAGYKPTYSLMNDLYYYNIYEDPTSTYRSTEQAMQAIVNLYGVEYGEGKTYKTLEEAYKSITGFNISEAKALMARACEQLVADGLYKKGENIVINVAYAKGAIQSDDNKQIALMNQYLNKALEGSGFGQITLQPVGNLSNRYAAVPAGEYAIGYGAWGGAAFYPFRNFQVYFDTEQYDVNEIACWDPATEKLTLTINGEEVTMTYKDWGNSMVGTGKYASADFKTKLAITAALEEDFLGKYYRIPLAATTTCSLLSYKVAYYTEDYNIMYDFGGFRLLKYEFSDAAWESYVAKHGNNISYK